MPFCVLNSNNIKLRIKFFKTKLLKLKNTYDKIIKTKVPQEEEKHEEIFCDNWGVISYIYFYGNIPKARNAKQKYNSWRSTKNTRIHFKNIYVERSNRRGITKV